MAVVKKNNGNFYCKFHCNFHNLGFSFVGMLILLSSLIKDAFGWPKAALFYFLGLFSGLGLGFFFGLGLVSEQREQNHIAD